MDENQDGAFHLAGDRLGKFVILSELGRGSMGVVYEAFQEDLKRKVALKVLPANITLDPKQVKRFHREAESVARLRHDNIIQVYEVGEIDQTHYFAMELVDGRSLEDFIAERPTPERAAALALQAARGLAHAHEKGVIHRDVKPSNLLVDRNGRVLVTDFGLARLSDSASLTSTDAIVGTPKYMSPEQILPGSGPLDGRTDVYSLAATLYQLVAGRPPFEAPTVQAYIRAILEERATSPRKLNKRVPHDLATIILRCLEKDPSDRYAGAAELADDLERFLGGERILAKPKGTLAIGFETLRRHKLVTSLAAVALLATLVVLALGGKLDTTEQIVRVRQIEDPFAAVPAAKRLLKSNPGDADVQRLVRDMHSQRADARLQQAGASVEKIMEDLAQAGRKRGFWYLYLLADADPAAARAALESLETSSPLWQLINAYLNFKNGDYYAVKEGLRDLTFSTPRYRAFQNYLLGKASRGLADRYANDAAFAEMADQDREGYLTDAERYLQIARAAGGDRLKALLSNRIRFEEAAVRNALRPEEDSVKIITDLVSDIGARLLWSRNQLTRFAGTGAQAKIARAFVERVLRMAGLGDEVLTGSGLESEARTRLRNARVERERAMAQLLLAVSLLSQSRAAPAFDALGEFPLAEASLRPYALWTESLVHRAQENFTQAIGAARAAVESAGKAPGFVDYELLARYTTLLAEEARGAGHGEEAKRFAGFLKTFLADGLPRDTRRASWTNELIEALSRLTAS